MQNDSDAEDVSHPPLCGCPSSQETLAGAGRALSDVAGYTELNRAMTDDPGTLSRPKTTLILQAG